MNDHDDEIGTGGRVDPDAITDTPDEPDTGNQRRWLTGRAAQRAYRYGHGAEKPNRSRCQRLTPKQRAFGPTGRALQRKQARRSARSAAWLNAERQWNEQVAA